MSGNEKPGWRRDFLYVYVDQDEDDVVLVQDLEVVEVSASKVKG